MKFTEKGEVVLSVDKQGSSSLGTDLHFAVSDTGVGIPPEQLERIFDRFTQADGSDTRQYGGTGLGTTIARQLTEMMGGRIWVESEVGRGSVFHFVIPAGSGAINAEPLLLRIAQLIGKKVLIVDDNATTRRILKETMSAWGMIAAEAASGEAALEKVSDASVMGGQFDLAVLDINMPDMDGVELAGQFQDSPLLNKLPFLFLDSFDHDNRRRCKCSGLHEAVFLVKPVRQKELLDGILIALGEKCSTAPMPEPKDILTRALKPLNVLLAEDNDFNQKLALTVLKKRGHRAEVVGNGRQAVEKFRRGRFDAILMDVQMPEMDGMEATRSIRRLEKEQGDGHILIVAMTAHAMHDVRERCLEAGMDRYITKPITREKLFEILESAPVFQENAGTEGPPEPPPTDSLDVKALLSLVDNDMTLLDELVSIYLNQVPERMNRLREAIRAGSESDLEQTAHSLKGISLNLTAQKVADVAWKLEAAGREGDLDKAADILGELEIRIAELVPELQRLCREHLPEDSCPESF